MPSCPGERSQVRVNGAMVSLRYNLTTSTTYGKKIKKCTGPKSQGGKLDFSLILTCVEFECSSIDAW